MNPQIPKYSKELECEDEAIFPYVCKSSIQGWIIDSVQDYA